MLKGVFLRASETDRLSDKKDYVTTFVALNYIAIIFIHEKETTELRDKFCVYKLLTFQYYFNKVIVQLLYEADVLSHFGVASTHNFLKEPIFVHRVTSPHILSMYYGTREKPERDYAAVLRFS